jgi:hypothetical protein
MPGASPCGPPTDQMQGRAKMMTVGGPLAGRHVTTHATGRNALDVRVAEPRPSRDHDDEFLEDHFGVRKLEANGMGGTVESVDVGIKFEQPAVPHGDCVEDVHPHKKPTVKYRDSCVARMHEFAVDECLPVGTDVGR